MMFLRSRRLSAVRNQLLRFASMEQRWPRSSLICAARIEGQNP